MTHAILILGMHRSGTSCLAGCLKLLGLNLGPVSQYNYYNKKGNQENKQVFKFNESILNFNYGQWNSPPTSKLKLNSELKKQLLHIIHRYDKFDKPWGIKDPRMLLTYDLWQNSLPKHILVGTFRHPQAVADSLFARESFPVEIKKGLELWKIYNLKLLEIYKQNKFRLINFDLPENEYILKLKEIASSLSLTFLKDAVFFEPGLRNQTQYTFEQCPDDLKPIYSQLLEISQCK